MQGFKPSSQPSGPFRVEISDTYSDGTPRYRNYGANTGAINPQSYTGQLLTIISPLSTLGNPCYQQAVDCGLRQGNKRLPYPANFLASYVQECQQAATI